MTPEEFHKFINGMTPFDQRTWYGKVLKLAWKDIQESIDVHGTHRNRYAQSPEYITNQPLFQAMDKGASTSLIIDTRAGQMKGH